VDILGKWLIDRLIQSDLAIKTVQIQSVLKRHLTSIRNIHFRRFNDLRKKVTGKSFVVPLVLHFLKLYEQVTDTVPPLNTGEDNRKSPVGTSQMVTS